MDGRRAFGFSFPAEGGRWGYIDPAHSRNAQIIGIGPPRRQPFHTGSGTKKAAETIPSPRPRRSDPKRTLTSSRGQPRKLAGAAPALAEGGQPIGIGLGLRRNGVREQ